jgi:hypothetical protein
MKLIQTKDYLLLIDEETEINGKETLYIFESDTGLVNTIDKEYKENEFDSKIIAYHPLTKEAKELDLPLLPNFEEVDVFTQTKNFNKQVKNPYLTEEKEYQVWERAYIEGFDDCKTQSKQFSLEDVKKAIEIARDTYWDIDNRGFSSNTEGDWSYKYSEEEIIQSLSTQQLPKEFIPRYEYQTREGDWKEVLLPSEWFSIDEGDNPKRLKIITNSEGKEEIQGDYVY